MDLNALQPDEVVMLPVNEHRGTGGKGCTCGWTAGAQEDSLLRFSGYSIAAAGALPGWAAEGSVYEIQPESTGVPGCTFEVTVLNPYVRVKGN